MSAPVGQIRATRDAAARAFGVEPFLMAGGSRRDHVVRARHAGIWVIHRRWPEVSLSQIGRYYGGRDHSTIIHAVRTADDRRATCTAYRAATDALLAMELDAVPVIPADVAQQLMRMAAESAARMAPSGPSTQTMHRAFMAEVNTYPDPLPFQLGIQMKRQAGCPGLQLDEIAARREAVLRERRAHELALLEAEQRRYRLPRRGLALSEMAV